MSSTALLKGCKPIWTENEGVYDRCKKTDSYNMHPRCAIALNVQRIHPYYG